MNELSGLVICLSTLIYLPQIEKNKKKRIKDQIYLDTKFFLKHELNLYVECDNRSIHHIEQEKVRFDTTNSPFTILYKQVVCCKCVINKTFFLF